MAMNIFFKSKFFLFFIIYWFWVYGLVVRQAYILNSVPLDISSTPTGTIHSYHDVTIPCGLLVSLDYSVTTGLSFFLPSPLSPSAPAALPLATTLLSLSDPCGYG